MLSSASFIEEGVKRIISPYQRFCSWHQPIWPDPMFQAIQLPAGIAYLDTGLTNVNWDTLTL